MWFQGMTSVLGCFMPLIWYWIRLLVESFTLPFIILSAFLMSGIVTWLYITYGTHKRISQAICYVRPFVFLSTQMNLNIPQNCNIRVLRICTRLFTARLLVDSIRTALEVAVIQGDSFCTRPKKMRISQRLFIRFWTCIYEYIPCFMRSMLILVCRSLTSWRHRDNDWHLAPCRARPCHCVVR